MISISKSTNIIQELLPQVFDIQDDFTNLNEYDLAFRLNQLNMTLVASYLEKLDDSFANSSNRLENYYIKQKRKRTIVTTIGPITFSRRQYLHRKTGDYFYYVDSLFDLVSYQRISNTLKFEILKMITDRSYSKTATHFGVSKQTVFNTIYSLKNIIFSPPDFIQKRTLHHLYIQADECYVSLQTHKHPDKKSNKIRIEEVTIHEGIVPVCKGRNKLVNRTLFTRNSNESTSMFYQRIKAWIQRNYHYESLYLYGDGASWITHCAKQLNATFILDLYHTKQAINRLSRDKSIRKFATEFLIKNKFSAFESLYSALIDMNYPLTKQAHQSFDYLVKHWMHIQLNFSLPQSVGCSQEGINFHYFASRLTTFPRGWSEHNVRTVAGLLTLIHNHNALKSLHELLIPTSISLETVIKDSRLGESIPYVVIESLSDNHQFHKQGYLHLNHFRLN